MHRSVKAMRVRILLDDSDKQCVQVPTGSPKVVSGWESGGSVKGRSE